ncbi:hypothetical protein LPJ70_002430, partial [Coemansia sp. RSA 2708]
DSVPSSVADTVKIYTGNISAKDELFAAGFGITEPENSTSMATQLMSVELTVGNDTFCSENSHSYDPKYLICTDGTPGKDTCAGDSGGPLAKHIDGEMALTGITSYAPVTDSNPDGLCAQAGSSGYYVHVNAYLPWITKVTGLNEADITIGGLQDSSSSESENEVYDESSSEQTTDNSGEKFSSTISDASSSASGAVSSSASSYDYGSASSYDNGSASSYDNGSASSYDNGSESKYDSGDVSSYIGSESESTDEWELISSYSVTDTELGGLSDDSSFDESSYSDDSLAESNGTSETEDSSSFYDLSTDEDINSDLFFTDESVYSSDSDSESSEIIFSSASYPYVDNGNSNDPELEHLSEGDTGKAAMLEPSFKLAISLVAIDTGLSLDEHPSLAKRVNGGSQLNLQGFDYIVYIQPAFAAANVKACSGVLLSSKYVLTMQSCLGSGGLIINNDYSQINVTVGKVVSSTERRSYTYSVVKAFTSSEFEPAGYYNGLAVLQLDNDVPANVAKPIKIYAGDYKADARLKLAGFATNSTQDSNVDMTQLRYEYLHIGSDDYCLDANSEYNPDTEICARVTAGVSTCNGDFGAPLLMYVNNRDTGSSGNSDDSVIVESTSDKSKAFAGYALVGLVNFGYNQVLSSSISCIYGGNMAFFTWMYPYIDQIANLTGLHVEKFTVVNTTASDSLESYMHPEMSFPIQSEAQNDVESRASRLDTTPVYITVALGISLALFNYKPTFN